MPVDLGPFPASPSIIPDSEISPVRLETKTYPQCGLPKHTGSLSGDAHPPARTLGLPHGSLVALVLQIPDAIVKRPCLPGSSPARLRPGLLHSRGVTPLLRYYEPMRQSRCLLPPLRRSAPYRRCPCRLRHPRLVIGTFPPLTLLFCPEVPRPLCRRSSGCP